MAAGEAPKDVPSAAAAFKPFVPASQSPVELTFRAALIGSVLGILFGASSVYLALKVGLTVSASIPIAVLSIPIFRALGKGSILENNMTQTVGSAGESIAAGVVFTVPALIILGYDLEISTTTMIALTGGWLGVLLMIPLRQSLIVKEHGVLTYPEGTACAEVLEAGEQKGVKAGLVFAGLVTGLLYKFLYKGLVLWKEVPEKALGWYKGASVGVEASPELMGVGYIIGPKIASIMAGGGVLSFLVLIPMIRFFGEHLTAPLFPGSIPISEMSNYGIRSAYVAYIGAGAVAAGGIMSLARALPTIVSAFAAGVKGFSSAGGPSGANVPRTERDMPLGVTAIGVVVIALALWLLPGLHINIVAAFLMVIFGFFFSTVSSRICGQIGSSSNPVSGMTIATILLTCLLFVTVGWTGASYRPLALMIGAVVCIAAANAGATSQDLKTGFLVGATPRKQQLGLLIGVTTSAVAVGWTLLFINRAYTSTVYKGDAFKHYRASVAADAPEKNGPDGKPYKVIRLRTPDDRARVHAGTYLVDGAGTLAFVEDEVAPMRAGQGFRADVSAAPTLKGPDAVDYKVVTVAATPALSPGVYLIDAQGVPHYKRGLGLDGWWVPVALAHVRLPVADARGEQAAPDGKTYQSLALPDGEATASVPAGDYLANDQGRLIWRIGVPSELAAYLDPVTGGATVSPEELAVTPTQIGPGGQRFHVRSSPAGMVLVDATGVPRFRIVRPDPDRIFRPVPAVPYRALPSELAGQQTGPDGKSYGLLTLATDDASAVVPPGKYLATTDGAIQFVEDPGVGGREEYKVDPHTGRPIIDPSTNKPIPATKLTAPKANLMAVLIDGLLTHKLPWALVLFGVFIAFMLELSGIEALAFAVGLYLPLSSSTPIWAGGMVRRLADRGKKVDEGDTGSGVLFASGLIAGGSFCGLFIAALAAKFGEDGLSLPHILGLDGTALGDALGSNWLSTVIFCVLGYALYRVARKRD